MQFMNFEKTVVYRRRGGVLGFVQTAVMNATDLAVLNLLFLLTALPLVTAGAAVMALHSVCGSIARDQPVLACRDYIAALRLYLRRDNWSGLIYVAVLLLGGFSFGCYFEWAHCYPLLYPVAALTLSALIAAALIATVYFPYITREGCSRISALGYALKVAVARLDRTAPAVAVSSAAFMATAMLMPCGVILLLILPFSLSALAACYATKGFIK